MSLSFTEHDVAVWQGDALEQLTLMQTGSVQCAVTSPPYFGLRDYGTGRWEGGAEDCDHSTARLQNEISDKRGLGGGKGAVGRGVRNACVCGAIRVDEQLGLESSPAEYVARMVAVFAEVRRVLASDGVLWLNLGDSYQSHDPGGWRQGEHLNPGGRQAAKGSGRNRAGTHDPGIAPKNLLGMPWRTAFALQDDGWILRNAVVWAKPNAMPESVTDRLSTRYELVFLFSKSRRYWFDLDAIREPHEATSIYQQEVARRRPMASGKAGTAVVPGSAAQHGFAAGRRELNQSGRNPGDVWAISTTQFTGAHFACMPPALAERCIKAGCPAGGTVLDPFVGSGTTLAAARKLGRKSVGIELNPDYIELIRARIGQTPLEFDDASAPIVGLEPGAVQDMFDFGEAAL
jgi:DNA modification methylase